MGPNNAQGARSGTGPGGGGQASDAPNALLGRRLQQARERAKRGAAQTSEVKNRTAKNKFTREEFAVVMTFEDASSIWQIEVGHFKKRLGLDFICKWMAKCGYEWGSAQLDDALACSLQLENEAGVRGNVVRWFGELFALHLLHAGTTNQQVRALEGHTIVKQANVHMAELLSKRIEDLPRRLHREQRRQQ